MTAVAAERRGAATPSAAACVQCRRERVPRDTPPAPAPDRRPPEPRPRDAARPRRLRAAALRRALDGPERGAARHEPLHSIDDLVAEAGELAGLGVKALLLFGVPDEKDDEGSGAWDEDGVVQRALRALRAEQPGLVLITDVCLCEYTAHGHCGVIRDGEVANDETLELLARTAVSHVEAGADAVAPSDMMDGRVGAIREALPETPIVAYAAKYASAFYGPFREVAESTPSFGDRRGYQMDPPTSARRCASASSISPRAPTC